jgi:AcrR family transcriptional regulator
MPRVRSARAHQQVIDAALQLFSERGIDHTSMDAIAERAGVSKATIYNHWPDKDALCFEVLNELQQSWQHPVLRHQDVRLNLIALLTHQATKKHSELQSRLMPHFAAYAARNPAFARMWRARVMEPAQTEIRKLLCQAIREGQLPPSLDLDLSLALLLGPLLYYRILEHSNTAHPRSMPQLVVDAFWAAHAAEPFQSAAVSPSPTALPPSPVSK